MSRSTNLPTDRLSADFYNQWPGLFDSTSNWYDFTLIKVEAEYSPYKGSVELVLGLLGFILIITYTYNFDFVERMTSLKDEVLAEIEAENPGMTVEDPLGVLDNLEED